MSEQPTWFERTLEVYSEEDESLVDEHVLPAVDLALLQRSCGQPADEPMFDMFEVTEAQRAFVESLTGLKLDFRKYSYFLAAHATDPRAMEDQGGFMGRFAPPRELPAFPDAKRVKPQTPAR